MVVNAYNIMIFSKRQGIFIWRGSKFCKIIDKDQSQKCRNEVGGVGKGWYRSRFSDFCLLHREKTC